MCGQRDLKKVDNRRNPYQISSCSGLTRAHEGIGRNCVDRKTKKPNKKGSKSCQLEMCRRAWISCQRQMLMTTIRSENEKGNFNARDGWRDIGSSYSATSENRLVKL